MRAGIVAAATANCWRGKGSDPVSPLDFVPDWGGLRAEEELAGVLDRRQSVEELKATMIAMTRAAGGKVIDNGEHRAT